MGPSLTISGTITDVVTGQPVVGALVVQEGSGTTISGKAPAPTRSDVRGKYSLNLSQQPHRLTASAPGYQTQSVTFQTDSASAGLWWGFKVLWQDFQLQPNN